MGSQARHPVPSPENSTGPGTPPVGRDRIPLSAQIICVVDVSDALTTTRSYRAAMDLDGALGIMEESRHWWRPEVYTAFRAAVPAATPVDPARRQDAIAAPGSPVSETSNAPGNL